MGYMKDKGGRRLDSHTVYDLNPVYHLNAYENFFSSVVNGLQNVFVTGQATTATTLTAGVSAGASVLPVASASGISAGVVLVTGEGTANQQIHRVASVASNNVTLAAPVTNALSSGANVTPLWVNSTHLTITGGFTALARFIAQAKDSSNAFIIANRRNGTPPKVTLLGNSWISQGTTQWATAIQARLPGATVVNAGVAGNTLAAMLARFDTDVPADSDYVIINETGVNDVANAVTAQTVASQLETVIGKIRALGAVPIVVGMVPLSDFPFTSGARQQEMKALFTNGKTYPALSGVGADSRYLASTRYGTGSLGVGQNALDKTTTGDFNTAFGVFAMQNVTSGGSNAAFGLSACSALAGGSGNTGIGSNALASVSGSSSNTAVGNSALGSATGANNSALGRFALLSQTSATDNTGIGFQAGRAVTTGPSNTMLGYGAGYDPNAVAANATTTAQGQTLVGKQSGQGSATQRDYITCLGYRTLASGAGAVAIGTDSGGVGASAGAANEIALGTANHRVKVLGLPTTDPHVVGYLWANSGVVTVSAG